MMTSGFTSQTCISLLLAQEDLTPGYQAIKSIKPKPYRKIEILKDVALISIVGEGLLQNKGIAAEKPNRITLRRVSITNVAGVSSTSWGMWWPRPMPNTKR